MLSNKYLIDIIVNQNAEGILYHNNCGIHINSQTGLTPKQARDWLNSTIFSVGMNYVYYTDENGYGLGMERVRAEMGPEDVYESVVDVPPVMRSYIHILPQIVDVILEENLYAAFDVKPLNVFCVEKDNPDVVLIAYHEDDDNVDPTESL